MKIKSSYLNLLLCTSVILRPGLASAQPAAHYVPGVEGFDCATLPPPGFYLRDYTAFYNADRLNDSTGKSVGPANFNILCAANVPRLVWMSETKFLGANLGASTLLPIEYLRVTAGPRRTAVGISDLLVDGLMSWHLQRFDFAFAAPIWAPTGESSARGLRAGKGYWAGMPTVGGTWNIDRDKTWTLSVLNRYEINAEASDTHITTGNVYTLEWGLRKSFHKTMDLGLAGYYQQKLTGDRGPGASALLNDVAGVGPEIRVVIPKIEVQASLRFVDEFMAENRAQGDTVTLTFTKRF